MHNSISKQIKIALFCAKIKWFKFSKKGVDFSALLCYTDIHSSKGTIKQNTVLFLALPKTMVEARKLISNAKHTKGRLPVL